MNEAQRKARLINWELFHISGQSTRLQRYLLKYGMNEEKLVLVDIVNSLKDKVEAARRKEKN